MYCIIVSPYLNAWNNLCPCPWQKVMELVDPSGLFQPKSFFSLLAVEGTDIHLNQYFRMYLKTLIANKVFKCLWLGMSLNLSVVKHGLAMNFSFILVVSFLHWHSILPSICLPLIPRFPIMWTRKAEKLNSIIIANKSASHYRIIHTKLLPFQ